MARDLGESGEPVFGRRNPGHEPGRHCAFVAQGFAPEKVGGLDGRRALVDRQDARVAIELRHADAEDIDLDIQYGTGSWPGCNSHRLTWETITPLCAPRVLRAQEDLRSQTLLHVLGYHEGWGIWLKAAGVQGVESGSGLHLDTSLTAFELAAQGGGVALGRSSLVAPALASGRLVAPFSLQVPIEEAFHLVEPAGGARHPDAAGFTDWLVRAALAP